jgi:mRNA-degrading endonuclease toxin of MazEF toxin-antitoxin module
VFRVVTSRLGRRCAAGVCADQIRTVSKTRLTRKIGALSASEATALQELLTEMYGKP